MKSQCTLPNDGTSMDDIIKLQLRKPKHWHWELTTSKSSPNIAFPVIQLLNRNGKLLVEAKDNGSFRQCWNSASNAVDVNKNIISFDGAKNKLRKSQSEVKNNLSNKLESTRDKRNGKLTTKFNKSLKEVTNEKNRTDGRDSKTVEKGNGKKELRNNGSVGEILINISESTTGKDKETLRRLQKSKSDVLNYNVSFESNFRRNFLPRKIDEIIASPTVQKSSSSNEMYNYFVNRHKDASIERAISDGYRKFMEPKWYDADFRTRNINETSEDEFPKYVYKYRTSKAGTLVIGEEVNPKATATKTRRARRRTCEEDQQRDTFALNNNNSNDTKSSGRNLRASVSGKNHMKRHLSAPLHSKVVPNRYKEAFQFPEVKLERDKTTELCDDDILTTEDDMNKSVVDCGYIVQEPITASSDARSGRCSETLLISKRRGKNRRRRRSSADSSSSASSRDERGCRKRKLNKGKELPKAQEVKQGEGDATLLKLVRRLASESNHGRAVNMGANVSRHSSKGLSGRRSQSSGSICNGKGKYTGPCTESEIIGAKLCGSLPSYLDEPVRNGCSNNNHQNGGCVEEKQPLGQLEPLTQRVPPLGDGAPLHWKFTDNNAALCDQGYGSERSPEDEVPPPLPCHHHHHHLNPLACYPFITPESTFTVTLLKGSRGLGLSVTGGADSTGSWPGLIRVKRLFPHQPAATCGVLNVGDLLLEANGITLTGLTNYEALEVLRTTPNKVDLTICRPPPDVLSCVSPISEVPPPPPRRDPPSTLNLPSQPPFMLDDDHYEGEFDITLTKIQGSLGFTLRKEDDSALGHYVRALVREPALSDGRIQAGDKIIAVNDVEISSMNHEQAVQFLRQCGDEVRLRLYRDAAQTPVALLSPSETTPRTSFRPKPHLRQEAMDMLSDLAVRKLCPNNGNGTWRRSGSPNSSPRRLRRAQCPSDASTDSSSKYLTGDHEPLTPKFSNPCDDDSYNSLFINDSDDCDRPNRPCFLDLCSGSNPHGTPVVSRKPKFNFSLAHNAYELNNLDPEILDAPNLTYNMNRDGTGDCPTTDTECSDSFPKEHASMPYMPSEKAAFSYKNPVYQSAHPQCGTGECHNAVYAHEVQNEIKENSKTAPAAAHTITAAAAVAAYASDSDSSMMKWKGASMHQEEEVIKKKRSGERSRLNSCSELLDSETQNLTIELNRGWNSRLGFSLQGAAGVTYVSAVHADSVAAKDGRLKPGDRVLKVNDESVENLNTNDIIDLLRIIRGPISIVVSRTRPTQDCIEDRRFDTLDMK